MPLPRVRLELKSDFLPLVALRELLAQLAPWKDTLVLRWKEAYSRTFGETGFFKAEQLNGHMESELALIVECAGAGSLDDLWARLQEVGRSHAEAGVPYGELVIMMSLLEENVVAELAAHGASAEQQLAAYLLFDKLSHYRITKLAEAYFYRYVELIQEKTRALAEEQEKHEWSLMRAEKLTGLGQLAGGVAHELNNPLATISITVEDLQDALRIEAKDVPKKWPELAPALERIRSSVTRCIGIIGGMLDLARNRPPTNEEFRVNEMVARVAEMSALSSRSSVKKIMTSLTADLDEARSDPRQLEQVLMALLSNALDAVDPAGHVEVRTRRMGDFFAVEVQDDGCGIRPEHRERVFEPFFTTKPPGKGTGLGLSMAYSTVKRLEGRLTIESEPGRGTLARVVLPLTSTKVG